MNPFGKAPFGCRAPVPLHGAVCTPGPSLRLPTLPSGPWHPGDKLLAGELPRATLSFTQSGREHGSGPAGFGGQGRQELPDLKIVNPQSTHTCG